SGKNPIFNTQINIMKSSLILSFILIFGKWSFCQTNDSTAIVKLLEKESSTWRSGDSAAHAGCWKIEPFSMVIVITADGKTFSIPADKLVHAPKESMGKGGTSENSNYMMSIHGNNALVTHNETSTTPSGAVSHTFEVRMLEKINDEWKLTGQIIQVL
ncbi:MAG TPA: hypothetical protein VN726_11890, partial [Hanamia sp.]|nr:hypothetical protein [Hanamia sp.]